MVEAEVMAIVEWVKAACKQIKKNEYLLFNYYCF